MILEKLIKKKLTFKTKSKKNLLKKKFKISKLTLKNLIKKKYRLYKILSKVIFKEKLIKNDLNLCQKIISKVNILSNIFRKPDVKSKEI